jgi:hypothetical protein
MVIFNERHLRRVLSSYVGYYQGTRTLFGSTRIAPTHARLCHARFGKVVTIPKVGGLHHRLAA